MTLITSKLPLVGILSGLIFGALGMLLVGIDPERAGTSGLASILFKVLGSFLLFVSAASILNALFVLFRTFQARNRQD